MRTGKHNSARRGVILLLLLGMLAMLALMAMTFVIITSQSGRAAKVLEKIEQQTDPPERVLDQAFLQVVRGSENHHSVLWPHSLLEDMYGNDSVWGTIGAWQIPPPIGGQLLQFTPAGIPSAIQRVGCVLTMLDGPAAGLSTRIVGFVPGPPAEFQIVAFEGVDSAAVISFPYAAQSGPDYVINGTPFSGTGVGLLNTPVAVPNGPVLDAADSDPAPIGAPFALRPNPTAPSQNGQAEYATYLRGELGAAGLPWQPIAVNEDYDAVDYQNMLLAMILPKMSGPGGTVSSGTVPIPSLHRPELVNYWFRQLATAFFGATPTPADFQRLYRGFLNVWGPDGIPGNADDPLPALSQPQREAIIALKRKILLRPIPEDHPNFDGSNTNVDPVANVAGFDPIGDLAPDPNDPTTLIQDGIPDRFFWDVDNDGDGIADSIWVDIGLPVRSTLEGKLYKPLVAILCTDLDGRLNLNAHGSPSQFFPWYYTTWFDASADSPVNVGNPLPMGTPYDFAGGGRLARLPRGQGYGPAEINLWRLFYQPLLMSNPFSEALLMYRQTMHGGKDAPTGAWLEGRYGELTLRRSGGLPAPGITETGPGRIEDPLSHNKRFDYPADYVSTTASTASLLQLPRTGYGSPADIRGTMAVGINDYGQPIHRVAEGKLTDWIGPDDNPYEQDLSRGALRGKAAPAPVDNAFSISELEGLLRAYDVDQQQSPTRLARLTTPPGWRNSIFFDPTRQVDQRHEITTDSWDLPCIPKSTPELALAAEAVPYVTADLNYLGGLPPPPQPAAQQDERWLQELLPVRSFAQLARLTCYVNIRRAGPWNIGTTRSQIDTFVAQHLPVETLAGQRMNLNRPFGNGLDDDGNGVVDELNERTALGTDGERLDQSPANPNKPILVDAMGNLLAQPVYFDHHNDANLTGPNLARQEYARNLYLLAMLMADDASYPPWITNTSIYQNWAPGGGATPPYRRDLERARWLAQWAVNVVDFRDRDSAMTRFEYDPTPFDGAGAPSETVWGCERPELLITETTAFHDRRTGDHANELFDGQGPETAAGTTRDTDPTKRDKDFDQRLKPQGSLFVELYNPQVNTSQDSSATDPRPHDPGEPKPGEFYYDRTTQTFTDGVNLAALAPGSTPNELVPVWRMTVVYPGTSGGDRQRDPDSPSNLPPTDPNAPPSRDSVQRVIYFCAPDSQTVLPGLGGTASDPTVSNTAIVFHPSNDPQMNLADEVRKHPIRPGAYAVIGPADPVGAPDGITDTLSQVETHLGLQPGQNMEAGGDRTITLHPVGSPPLEITNVRAAGNDLPAATEIRMDNLVAVAINQPARLSVTEPASPYPPTGPDGQPYDPLNGYPVPYDEPLDRRLNASTPELWRDVLLHRGTFNNFCILHLQRLADPTRAYDPTANPYRTVDSSPVDLTTFNGVEDPAIAELSDPDPPSQDPPPPNPLYDPQQTRFFTRERGEAARANVPAGQPNANIWTHEPTAPNATGTWRRVRTSATPAGAVTGFVFGHSLDHTLGYLNRQFHYPGANPVDWFWTTPPARRGYPRTAFPWLTWNNRPFVSAQELLLVPAVSSSQLLGMYDIYCENAAGTGVATFPRPYSRAWGPRAVFPHLMDFFYSEPNDGAIPAGGANPAPPAQAHRLLDFVQVPSPFVGTEMELNPDTSPGPPAHRFHPPFNRISRYRDPGRVNLNTVFSPTVWLGLVNEFPGLGMDYQNQEKFFFQRFLPSRRIGAFLNPFLLNTDPNFMPPQTTVDVANNFADWRNLLAMNPNYPTRFVNPFRSSSGRYLVPTQEIYNAIPSEVDATLLRSSPVTVDPLSPAVADQHEIRPLFGFDRVSTYQGSTGKAFHQLVLDTPTGTAQFAGEFNNPDRNPYFRYQALTRLGNLVTTRSNVYAIWITVGYFEAERVQGPADPNVYPEGYTIGREMGIDTGEVKRHRGFYIFDRSIPVGFERGKDLNVDKAVLVKRFIE